MTSSGYSRQNRQDHHSSRSQCWCALCWIDGNITWISAVFIVASKPRVYESFRSPKYSSFDHRCHPAFTIFTVLSFTLLLVRLLHLISQIFFLHKVNVQVKWKHFEVWKCILSLMLSGAIHLKQVCESQLTGAGITGCTERRKHLLDFLVRGWWQNELIPEMLEYLFFLV